MTRRLASRCRVPSAAAASLPPAQRKRPTGTPLSTSAEPSSAILDATTRVPCNGVILESVACGTGGGTNQRSANFMHGWGVLCCASQEETQGTFLPSALSCAKFHPSVSACVGRAPAPDREGRGDWRAHVSSPHTSRPTGPGKTKRHVHAASIFTDYGEK